MNRPRGFPTGEVFYVCDTWRRCRAASSCWEAIPEQVYRVGLDPTCACGQHETMRLDLSTAIRELSR